MLILLPPARFVCAHLTAYEQKLPQRIADYNWIVGSLIFPPLPISLSSSRKPSTALTTIYDTSHLFFFGDLNFRLDLPETHPLRGPNNHDSLVSALDSESKREDLKEYDQLRVEQKKGAVCVGLREGDFWKFKVCPPRFVLRVVICGGFMQVCFCSVRTSMGLAKSTNTGERGTHAPQCGADFSSDSSKRTPSWTDRVLYTTYSDDPQTPEKSNITNLLYTSVPGYTTSDHVNPFHSVTHYPYLTTARLHRNRSSLSFSFRLPPLDQHLPKGGTLRFRSSNSLQTSNPSSYRMPP